MQLLFKRPGPQGFQQDGFFFNREVMQFLSKGTGSLRESLRVLEPHCQDELSSDCPLQGIFVASNSCLLIQGMRGEFQLIVCLAALWNSEGTLRFPVFWFFEFLGVPIVILLRRT